MKSSLQEHWKDRTADIIVPRTTTCYIDNTEFRALQLVSRHHRSLLVRFHLTSHVNHRNIWRETFFVGEFTTFKLISPLTIFASQTYVVAWVVFGWRSSVAIFWFLQGKYIEKGKTELKACREQLWWHPPRPSFANKVVWCIHQVVKCRKRSSMKPVYLPNQCCSRIANVPLCCSARLLCGMIKDNPQSDVCDRTLMKKGIVSSMPRLHDGVEHIQENDVWKSIVQEKWDCVCSLSVFLWNVSDRGNFHVEPGWSERIWRNDVCSRVELLTSIQVDVPIPAQIPELMNSSKISSL